MLKLFFIFALSAPVYAETLEAIKGDYDFKKAPEFQAIMGELRPYGAFSEKSTRPNEPESRTMSRGEQAVEEAKARNRAILAQKYKEEKEQVQGKTESEVEEWRAEVKKTHEGWKKEVEATRAQWRREQEIFLGRLKVYKENTFEIPVKKQKIIEQVIIPENLPEVHVVNEAFTVPIQDQKNRPTCSAFAGIRAIEVILAQHKLDKDLSEQYFYWSSKPNCQNRPCSEKGSWVTPGFKYSQGHAGFDMPLESACGYSARPLEQNETHTPLSNECREGFTKVLAFQEVRTLAEVIEKLKQDIPVIMAAKLSENFYKNHGLVKLADSESSGKKLDSHSKGHAFLAVGVIELPEKLRSEEGNYCILIANSWGKGWGAGGYSCLTEKWLVKFRQPSPFVAVTKISIK